MSYCSTNLKSLILNYVSMGLKNCISRVNDGSLKKVNEIRFRSGNPIMFCEAKNDFFITEQGTLTKEIDLAMKSKQGDLIEMLEMICSHSIYAYMDNIRNGFITLEGGHRVGIAGKVIIENGDIKYIKNVSSINIRFARQMIGVANNVIKYIIKDNGGIYNTLIISPPGYGKTTLLRDIARIISDGDKQINYKGMKTGIIDERSEIASSVNGVPQNYVGIRSDIMDSCPKATGMMLMLRTMSPQVIITDEIGNEKDFGAIKEIVNCGVGIITTAHGANVREVEKRCTISNLLKERIFERFIILGKNNLVGCIEDILEGETLESLLVA